MVKCSCSFVHHHAHKGDNPQQIKVAPNLRMDSLLQGKLSAVGCIPQEGQGSHLPTPVVSFSSYRVPWVWGMERGVSHLSFLVATTTNIEESYK